MPKSSFANRLSWTILGVVAVVFVLALLAVNLVYQEKISSTKMLIAFAAIALVSLVVLYLICYYFIRTQSRPITALSESALKMESELNLARSIQMGMLNTRFPSQLYAMVHPAKEVGGDLYDFTLKDDTLYFAIGDVSGKGMPASLMMAITNAALHIVSSMGLPLDETLRRINDSVSAANSRGMFVTLFVARIDLKTRRMEYCNAGHNPILILPPEGEPYFLKPKTNIAIGLFEGFAYEDETVDFQAGTRIVAYTDGVTEAEKADNSQYGKDRLLTWARTPKPTMDDHSEKQVVESLYDSVKDFADGYPQNDDITIISIHLT